MAYFDCNSFGVWDLFMFDGWSNNFFPDEWLELIGFIYVSMMSLLSGSRFKVRHCIALIGDEALKCRT